MAARSPVCSEDEDAHGDEEIRAQSNLRRHSQHYFCLLLMVLDICYFHLHVRILLTKGYLG